MKIYLNTIIFAWLTCFLTHSSAFCQETFSYCSFPSMSSGLLEIAKSKGYLVDEGLKVEIHNTISGKICLDELIAKRVDFTSFADSTYVYSSSTELPIKFLASIKDVNGGSIVSRKSHGITSFESLQGKTLACLPGTVSCIFIYKLFDKLSFPRSKFKLLTFQAPAMVQALIGNQIDAISTWEPWTSNALENIGEDSIKLVMQDLYKFHALLAMHTDNIPLKSEIAKKLIKALIRVEEFVENNPYETSQILAVFLKMKQEIVVEELKNSVTHISFPADILPLMDETYRLIKKYEPNFESETKPDFKKSFHIAPLNEIAPERVDAMWK